MLPDLRRFCGEEGIAARKKKGDGHERPHAPATAAMMMRAAAALRPPSRGQPLLPPGSQSFSSTDVMSTSMSEPYTCDSDMVRSSKMSGTLT